MSGDYPVSVDAETSGVICILLCYVLPIRFCYSLVTPLIALLACFWIATSVLQVHQKCKT